MAEVSLFEHNEKAYKLLIESLKGHRFTTINHATGTGKSFIALKYLYENRDKKYLYISPTYPIIDQLMDSCDSIGINKSELNVDTMIYRGLLDLDMEALCEKYDGFILDEYHRTGARETGKKIRELKAAIEKSGKDKKVIGLTATPVRYLDDERNMTEEIFDGVVASRLSLAEAILEGLLPAPMYANSKIACMPKYQKLYKRISRLEECEEKQELLTEIRQLGEKIGSEENTIQELIQKNIKEKDGKYIIFCSSVEELAKYYEMADTWFGHLENVKKYQVHSYQHREKNKEELAEFNKNKEGISILFGVDILNEGVHVKGIDGVIMLRRTTSPIIYFQQIGRALSFSGRKKQIKILDLVNNFANHGAIYAVYEEIKEELKKKIQLEPHRKAEYEAILNRFVILDETRGIIEEMSQIASKLTRETLINSRVTKAINVLIELNDKKLNDEIEEQLRQSFIVLNKYYKYVTDEQLEKLLELNIMLPKGLMGDIEKRKENLDGFSSIHEKEKNTFDEINLIIKFIKVNKRIPSQMSTYKTERELGKVYYEHLSCLTPEQKKLLLEAINSSHVKIEIWEKALLSDKITKKDLKDLIEFANSYISSAQMLPTYLYDAIYDIAIKYEDVIDVSELYSLMKQSDDLYSNKMTKQYSEMKLVRALLSEITANFDSLDDPEFAQEFDKKIQSLSEEGKKCIFNSIANRKMKRYSQILPKEAETNKSLVANMKGASKEKIAERIAANNAIKDANELILEILKFKLNNSGVLPSIDSKNVEEVKLAKQLQELVKNFPNGDEIFDMLIGNGIYDFNGIKRKIDELLNAKVQDTISDVNDKRYILELFEYVEDNVDEEEEEEKSVYSEFCSQMDTITEEEIENQLIEYEKAKERYGHILDFFERKLFDFATLKIVEGSQEDKALISKMETDVDKEEIYKLVGNVIESSIHNVENKYKKQEISLMIEKELKERLQKEIIDKEIRISVLNVISFFRKRNRRPLKNSRNPEEAIIAEKYEKFALKNLPTTCITILNKRLNAKQSLENACSEYLKNLKFGEER